MDDHTLFNDAPIPILLLDPIGIIQEANPAARAFYGYEAEALIGQPIAALAALIAVFSRNTPFGAPCKRSVTGTA